MTTIHIACAADDRYVAHVAAMLHSVRAHEPRAVVNVHFLSGPEPSAPLRRELASMTDALGVGLNWVAVDPRLVEGLPRRGYLSEVVWYRLFMPQLLPGLERVLYIDGDVIAQDSILPLWETPLGDDLLGAVTNVVPEGHRHRAAQLGLPGPERYFNLGVALWNLERMRREGFTAQVLEYARANLERLVWLEQDAVNALFWRRRRALHPRWNCQNGIYYRSWGVSLLDAAQVEEAIRSPGLMHFEGGSFAKPWHYLSQHPRREEYFRHRALTPWPRVDIEGRTLRNQIRKRLPEPVLRGWQRLRAALRSGPSRRG